MKNQMPSIQPKPESMDTAAAAPKEPMMPTNPKIIGIKKKKKIKSIADLKEAASAFPPKKY